MLDPFRPILFSYGHFILAGSGDFQASRGRRSGIPKPNFDLTGFKTKAIALFTIIANIQFESSNAGIGAAY